ncbi:hypothetical protein [Sphingomonas sp.]|jgi:hypothetical protein|uniref:hypothetical protein n=1 Tax=Sphingomonas sp. TaxID=28214 RepID=UPI002DF1000F|nr:hypothetical protein [Sphingomonas sp.]
MFLLSAFALAAAPPALTDPQQQQLRCVALLAIVAGEQERRTAAALELPPLARQGARFAQLTGEALVKQGRSQEQVRELILQQVSAIQKSAGADAKLPVEEARACVTLMNQVAPPLPPPPALQCAGLLKLAADDVRKREGMSKTAMDLITLASVLETRARSELGAAGRTEAQSDRELTLAREAIAAKPDTAPDMEACVELARP